MAKSGKIRAGFAYVELFADSSKLRRGLKKAQARISSWAKTVGRIGAMVTGVGVAMLAPFVKALSVFESVGDAIGKMSARTGVSVESLSQLAFAAERTGTNINSLGAAIFRMGRRVANAASGTGPAVRALNELGLSADALVQMPVEDQLFTIIDALHAMPNALRRNQMGFEIFGDNWRDIAPLLQNGSQEVRELMLQADRLGLTLDASTTAAAERFSDALGTLKNTLTAIWINVAAAVAGPVTDLIDALSHVTAYVIRWVKANQEVIQGIAITGVAITAVGAALLFVAGALAALAITIGVVSTIYGALLGAISAIAGFIMWAITPAGLAVVAIIVAIGAALKQLFTVDFPAMLGVLSAGLSRIAVELQSSLGQIPELLRIGEVELAFDILIASVGLAFLKLRKEMEAQLNKISSMWNAFWASLTFSDWFGNDNERIRQELARQRAASKRLTAQIDAATARLAELREEAAALTDVDSDPEPPPPTPAAAGAKAKIERAITAATSTFAAMNLRLTAPAANEQLEELQKIADNTGALVDQSNSQRGFIFQ